MNWETIERPGFLGKKRDELYQKWNGEHGDGNWRIAYQWGNVVVPRSLGISLYEDAYYEFFKKSPSVLEWLTTTASEVYDTAPSNVQAGFSYDVQETASNHIHDVAIRRVVTRLGKCFQGNCLLKIRGGVGEGGHLSPYNIPFHLPEMISREPIKDHTSMGSWWRRKGIENSTEEFYQQNKVLQIRQKV